MFYCIYGKFCKVIDIVCIYIRYFSGFVFDEGVICLLIFFCDVCDDLFSGVYG